MTAKDIEKEIEVRSALPFQLRAVKEFLQTQFYPLWTLLKDWGGSV